MGYITINSKFKPYSYDELVKPLIYYKEAYDKIEKDYSDLAAQAEAFKDIASQEENPEAYKLYKGYSDKLDKAMEDFSKGMTAANRKDLMKLKRDYSSSIGTISRAYQQASEENKRRSDILAKNPNIKMKNRAVKVDEYLGGKTPTNDYIDTSELLKRATLDFGNIAKTIVSDPKFKATANKYLNNVELSQGITPETLQKIMSDPNFRGTTAEQMYKEVFDRYNQIDINDYSERDQQDIMNAIRSAAYTGLNTIKNQFVSSGEEERQKISLGWASHRRGEDEFKARMAAEGFKSDGTIDKKSPIWEMKGVTWDEDGKIKIDPRSKLLNPSGGNRGNTSKDKMHNVGDVVEINTKTKNVNFTPLGKFDSSKQLLGYEEVNYDSLTPAEKLLLKNNGVNDPSVFIIKKKKGSVFTDESIIAIPIKGTVTEVPSNTPNSTNTPAPKGNSTGRAYEGA